MYHSPQSNHQEEGAGSHSKRYSQRDWWLLRSQILCSGRTWRDQVTHPASHGHLPGTPVLTERADSVPMERRGLMWL